MKIALGVKLEPGFDAKAAEKEVHESIKDLVGGLGFGAPLFLSQIVGAAMRAAGVESVISLEIEPLEAGEPSYQPGKHETVSFKDEDLVVTVARS